MPDNATLLFWAARCYRCGQAELMKDAAHPVEGYVQALRALCSTGNWSYMGIAEDTEHLPEGVPGLIHVACPQARLPETELRLSVVGGGECRAVYEARCHDCGHPVVAPAAYPSEINSYMRLRLGYEWLWDKNAPESAYWWRCIRCQARVREEMRETYRRRYVERETLDEFMAETGRLVDEYDARKAARLGA